MPDLYPIAKVFLWRLKPERAHWLALRALQAGLGFLASTESANTPDDPCLAQSVWGLRFRNPVGVAAGFDKDALVPDRLLERGFGAVEVGTVTPLPQSGNEGQRLFRLDEDRAIINRMGFPSAGFDTVERHLKSRHRQAGGILGVNIGKNRNTDDISEDYAEGIRRLGRLSDYIVVNVSSPNTPGLRDLQRRAPLQDLMSKLLEVRDEVAGKTPLLVKVAPDLSEDECADISDVALNLGIDGIVISNTTITRPDALQSEYAGAQGGFSGPQIFELSTKLLSDFYELTHGSIPLVGVGGISSAEDAYAKIKAGASLVQVHSALIFMGLSLVSRIKVGLVKLLAEDGFSSIAEAIGANHKALPAQSRRSTSPDGVRPRSRLPSLGAAIPQGT